MSEDTITAPGWCVQKNTIAWTVSRDLMLAYGLVEPTPQEAYEHARNHEKFREERARDHARMADYCARLDALTDPTARALLDLHAPKYERDKEMPQYPDEPQCGGCDFQGWESEPPGWPCRTVRLIGDQHGIEVPEGVWWG